MQKNERRLLLYCLAMCIVTGVVVTWLINSQQKRIAVVDAVKLFDGYNMKNELEELAKRQLQAESKQIDSIGNALEMAKGMHTDEEGIKRLSYSYDYMKAKLQKDYEQSNHDINEKVWKRLNPLLQDYGKKKHLHLIIGANGMSSVLYNDDYFDLTNEVIKYVN